jgi:hypothetical protein
MPTAPEDAAPVAAADIAHAAGARAADATRVDRVDRVPGRIAAVVLLLIACGFILLSMPSHYYAYYRSPERFTYPTHDVIAWCGAIAVEALVASVFLWRAHSVPGTCAILTVVYLPVGMFFAPFAMHAQPYYAAHLVFVFTAVVWFVLVAAGTLLVRRIAR